MKNTISVIVVVLLLLTMFQCKAETLDNMLKTRLLNQNSANGTNQNIEALMISKYKHTLLIKQQKTLSITQRLKMDKSFYLYAQKQLNLESSYFSNNITSFSDVGPYSGAFLYPIAGTITSSFGLRYHPIFHISTFHSGIDIAGNNHASVLAANGGKVLYSNYMKGYGNTVIILHGRHNNINISTLYGHLSEKFVSVGQKVKKGQVIGHEGSTGYSTGPHLHFEVRKNGEPVNPLLFLRSRLVKN